MSPGSLAQRARHQSSMASWCPPPLRDSLRARNRRGSWLAWIPVDQWHWGGQGRDLVQGDPERLGKRRPTCHLKAIHACCEEAALGNIQLKYFLGGVAIGGGGKRKQEAEHVRDASEDHNQFYAAKDFKTHTHTQNKRAQEEDIPSAMKSLKSSTATTSHTWKSTICDVSPSVTLPWTFTSLSREPKNSPKVMGKSDSPS